jgi:hypothetical protein
MKGKERFFAASLYAVGAYIILHSYTEPNIALSCSCSVQAAVYCGVLVNLDIRF